MKAETAPDWSLQEERTAQALLNQPDESLGCIENFKDRLLGSNQYMVMAKAKPREAAERIVRHLRKPLLAAFSAHGFHHAMHEVVPLLEDNVNFTCDVDRDYELEEELVVSENTLISGSAARYMLSMHSILDPAWEKIMADTRMPGTACAYFMQAFEPLQSTHKLLKPTAPSPANQVAMLPNDNAIVSLELLARARIDYADESYRFGHLPAADELTRRALKSAERLSWGTTANRSSVGMSLHIRRLSEIFTSVESYDPSQPGEEIARRTPLTCIHEDSGEFALAKSPLTEKPWDRARFCPASMVVLMPDAANRDIAKRFNDYCHRNQYPHPKTIPSRQGRIEDLASIDLGTFLMQLGALIGRQTIFQSWPQHWHKLQKQPSANSGSY